MSAIIAGVVLGLLSLAIVLAAYRVWKGPSSGNSAVAGDLVFFAFIGAVAVLGVLFGIEAVSFFIWFTFIGNRETFAMCPKF